MFIGILHAGSVPSTDHDSHVIANGIAKTVAIKLFLRASGYC
jgi:hypothetical protein